MSKTWEKLSPHDRIVAVHDLVPVPVRARPHGVNAWNAPDIARDNSTGTEQEARQRNNSAIAAFRRIRRLAPQRIVIAYSMCIVADIVPRCLIAPRLSRFTDLYADSPSQTLKAGFRDPGEFSFCLHTCLHGIVHFNGHQIYVVTTACSRARSALRFTLPAGFLGSSVTNSI